MFKHIFFIPGLILAFLITFVVLNYKSAEPQLIMIWFRMASLGILAFFSVFTPVFLGVEYRDGGMRNKVIAGHKQSEVYIADLIAILIGTVIMSLCWFAAGLTALIKAGFGIGSFDLVNAVTLVFIALSYSAIITCISLRCRKMLISVAIGFVLFVFGYFAGVTAFSINMLAGSGATAVIENLIPTGQWFGTINVDETLPAIVRILISSGWAVLITAIGTLSINKRELK